MAGTVFILFGNHFDPSFSYPAAYQ